ncbi:MAG: hypothetical protein ACI4P9_04430 [Selenomonadaceae bacterium]
MATTNFKVFNEANDAANTYNDSEYQNSTQRQTGVIPGMALSRMHNKMFFQWSTMATAIAQYLVSKGYNCMDDNIQGIEDALADVIGSAAEDLQPFLRQPSTAYAVGAVVYLPSIGAGLYLECTTAGTTDSGDLVISTPIPNATVVDGTVTWTIKKIGEVDISGKANVTLNNLDTNNLSVHVVVDSYHDDEGNWWRKYSDGWLEQGGVVATTDNEMKVITLNKPMANDKYTVLFARQNSEGGAYFPCLKSKTDTTISVLCYTSSTYWTVFGMGASE